MSFDRWIALVILSISLIYSYAAFFTMDQLLPPFMQRNPVWPSTFPKILGILLILVSLTVILGLEKNKNSNNGTEIDYRRILDYNLGPAIFLVIMMALYAITLRPLGFFISTITFLAVSGYALGERKILILFFVAALASFIIWYLVEQVLGIYLRPFPSIL
jgi:putative tricarboxylic transport membrane protein